MVCAIRNRMQIRYTRNESFCVQKPGGELEAMSRRAHGHRDPPCGTARPREPDLQGFLGGEPVLVLVQTGCVVLVHPDAGGGTRAAVAAHLFSLYLSPTVSRGPDGGWRYARAEATSALHPRRRLGLRDLVGVRAGRLPVPGVSRVHAARHRPPEIHRRVLQRGTATAVMGAVPARAGPHRPAGGVPADP